MRATLHARPCPGGALLLALAICALLPATAAAKPAVKIKSVDVPQAVVASGSAFELSAKLKNRSGKALRPATAEQFIDGDVESLGDCCEDGQRRILLVGGVDAGAAALTGPFTVFDLGDEENAVLYRESAFGDDIAHTSATVQYHRQVFEKLWDDALTEQGQGGGATGQLPDRGGSIARRHRAEG